VIGAFAEYEKSDFTFKFDAPFNTVRIKQDSAWWLGGRVGYTPNCCTLWFLSGGYTRNHTDFSSAGRAVLIYRFN
jgi:hypothetical protein